MDRQPLFLSLQGRRVAVVGDGPIAARRAATLLSGGAKVVLFAKKPHEEFLGLANRCLRGDLAANDAFERLRAVLFRARWRRRARRGPGRARESGGGAGQCRRSSRIQRFHQSLRARPFAADRRHLDRGRGAAARAHAEGAAGNADPGVLWTARGARRRRPRGARRQAVKPFGAAALLGAFLRGARRRNGAGGRRERRARGAGPRDLAHPARRLLPGRRGQGRGLSGRRRAGRSGPAHLPRLPADAEGRCRALRPAGRTHHSGARASRRRTHLCRQETLQPCAAAGGNRRTAW